jgi:YbbR domain-containing protein
MIKRIFNNLPVKIISFVVAAILWVIVIAGQSKAGYFPGKIPINYVNTPSNMIAISDVDSVRVKIIADPSTWSKLTISNFTAKVDLSNLSEGTHTLPIKIISNSDAVRIVEENPATVLVRIELAKTKAIPVVVKTVGQPKEGYDVISATTDPEEVNVTGPASLVDSLAQVTASVTLNDSIEDQSLQSKVMALNEQGESIEDLSFSPQQVAVKLKYGRSSTVKTVGIDVDTTGSLPSGYTLDKISVNPSSVTINGNENLLKNITDLSTKPLNLSNINSSITTDLDLVLPDGITLVDSVKTVKVITTVKQIDVSRDIIIPISIANVGNGLKVDKLSSQTATISVEGMLENINNVSADDFSLAIDMSGKGKGDYNIDLTPTMISTSLKNIKVSQVKPSNLTFSLTNN